MFVFTCSTVQKAGCMSTMKTLVTMERIERTIPAVFFFHVLAHLLQIYILYITANHFADHATMFFSPTRLTATGFH